MTPFIAKIEMRGRPVALMIGFGLFILVFAVMCGALSFYGEAPAWFGWLMVAILGLSSLSLFGWAGFCISRRVFWSFEATEEKMVWFWSDRSGVVREKKEVAVRDVVEVWRAHGGDTSGGLFLKMRSGECIAIGGVAQPERRFLEWVSVNYPDVSLNIE